MLISFSYNEPVALYCIIPEIVPGTWRCYHYASVVDAQINLPCHVIFYLHIHLHVHTVVRNNECNVKNLLTVVINVQI